MYKLANQVIDVYDDTNFQIMEKLAEINPKVNVIERDKLSDEDFALGIITKKANRLNKFAINTPDSTWLSNQYFQYTHGKLPKLAQEVAAHNIKLACVAFKIRPTEAVEKLAADHDTDLYFENENKYKLEDMDNMSKFAEVEQICNNETFAKYAFATPDDVRTASDYFEMYQKDLPAEYRYKYAAAVQKRAGELGMSVTGSIEKLAGNAYSAHVDAHLCSRKTLVNEKYAQALDKIAAAKDEMSPVDFAKLLHQFDKHAGLAKYYGGYLVDPYQATFATLPNSKCLFKTASGASITHDAIAKLASDKYDKIKEYFGKDLADALKKEAMPIYESLPLDAKEIIAGIADGTL